MDRLLRLGVSRRGVIVDDRLFPTSAPITIGRSFRCTLRLPDTVLPLDLRLVEPDPDGPRLLLPPGVRGELALDGVHPQPVASLGTTVRLTPETRGWLDVGDVRLHLQQLPKPKPTPVPLPPEVRTGLTSRLETGFLTLLAVVMVAQGAAVAVVHGRRMPEVDPFFEDVAGQAVRLPRLALPKPKPPKPEEVALVKHLRTKKIRSGDKPVSPPPKELAERREEVRRQVKDRGALAVLGTTGGTGALADVFREKDQLADVDEALSGVKDVRIASTGGMATKELVMPDAIGDLALEAGGSPVKLALGGKRSVVVPQIEFDCLVEPCGPTPANRKNLDEVTRLVKQHSRSLSFCYDRELKRDPSLSGKVSIQFEIRASGRVAGAELTEDDLQLDSLGSCLLGRVRSWKFPASEADPIPVLLPLVLAGGT